MSKGKIKKERHLVEVSEEELLERQRLILEKLEGKRGKPLPEKTFSKKSVLVWDCTVENSRFKKSSLSKTVKEYRSKRKLERKKNVDSPGEKFIEKELTKLKIDFKQEYIFEDCINPKTKRHLRFDFYIPSKNIAIEYDGVQHKKHCPEYNISIEQFKSQQFRDQIKTKYCTDNSITLIRFDHLNKRKIRKVLTKLKGSPPL